MTDMVIPPDREALRKQVLRAIGEELTAEGMVGYALDQKLADAVLALLPTEADTKALVETATRLGRELGRREVAEEAAAWLAEQERELKEQARTGGSEVINSHLRTRAGAFSDAARVITREIATEEPK